MSTANWMLDVPNVTKRHKNLFAKNRKSGVQILYFAHLKLLSLTDFA